MKLLYIKRELIMIFNFKLITGIIMRKIEIFRPACNIILVKILGNFNDHYLTKSQLAYTSTQGIGNIDVINKTIPNKRVDSGYGTLTFYFLKHWYIDLVCGMKKNSKKIEFQPLNMVFK